MTNATDSVADDMLRSAFERWQRLEAEKKAISDDLKELFAELKGNGFDSKATRAAFREVSTINDAAKTEHDALVDLYVASIVGTGTNIAMRATHATNARHEADIAGEVPRDASPASQSYSDYREAAE